MPPVYPTMSVLAAIAVVALELRWFRSGLFRSRAYWIAMGIVFAFMVPVDGWLTKLSAPIVKYDDADTSGWRPVWDILGEEFLYVLRGTLEFYSEFYETLTLREGDSLYFDSTMGHANASVGETDCLILDVCTGGARPMLG